MAYFVTCKRGFEFILATAFIAPPRPSESSRIVAYARAHEKLVTFER